MQPPDKARKGCGYAGVCQELLAAKLDIPVLGVCLGMQCLAQAFGGQVVKALEPIHGRLSAIDHSGHPLFAGISSGEAHSVLQAPLSYVSSVQHAEKRPECVTPLLRRPTASVGLRMQATRLYVIILLLSIWPPCPAACSQ